MRKHARLALSIFALVTLGPFLRDLSAALYGGTPFIQAQSIFTAGFVMGIMLIPYIALGTALTIGTGALVYHWRMRGNPPNPPAVETY